MSAFGGKADIDQQLVTNLDFEYTAGGVRVASGFPKWEPKPGASTAGTLAALTLAISHACRVGGEPATAREIRRTRSKACAEALGDGADGLEAAASLRRRYG